MVVRQGRAVAVVARLNNSSREGLATTDASIPLSIIIPVLNEEQNIETCLSGLQLLRKQGAEIVLVDGGSQDSTCLLAAPLVDHVIKSTQGRGTQMNAGATVAHGEFLLFLHVDTVLPSDFSLIMMPEAQWGFFPVQLSGSAWLFRVIECAMNLRSKITKIATGDQVICIQSDFFRRIGGFADIPLMEDVEICGRLRSESRPVLMPGTVVTSSRRWEQQGIVRTILRMWRLRLAFFFGACPHRLVKQYYL